MKRKANDAELESDHDYDYDDQANSKKSKTTSSGLDLVRLASTQSLLGRLESKQTQTPKMIQLQPGLVLIRQAMTVVQQNELLTQVNAIGQSPTHGFYQPQTTFGKPYRLKMLCVGQHWDSKTYKYNEK